VSKVLVVEDHPPLATVVAIGLRRSGHDVVRVGSVKRALETEGTFRCAVLDIDLPDGSGVELAQQLLDDARTECVVFYTATRDGGRRGRARIARASEPAFWNAPPRDLTEPAFPAG
jgi:DNA-binding response OmpR family regulator